LPIVLGHPEYYLRFGLVARLQPIIPPQFPPGPWRGYNVPMQTSDQPHLLAAKFHQPAAPRHGVARPALVARLNAGLAAGRPLALIAAPAGYGKTTLAAEWAAQLGRPSAWLTLDEADDDPLRFCAYFLAALQRVDPTIGAELAPALRGGQLPPQPVLVTTLLNDLTRTLDLAGSRKPTRFAPLACVLDDFHVIQDPAILAILQGLLAYPPTGLHLSLVTREDPVLPLARLRARDQLTEVRAADLRFDEAEAAAFLRDGMGLVLSPADLARLAERTEGWAAGLQLAGLSLQGRDDPAAFVADLSGSHRFILNYLTEEVLTRQPADVQAFLLHTSVLDQLSGELCDAVLGISESANQRINESLFAIRSFADAPFARSQTILEHLEHANIFLTPLDDEGRWYRYHGLFAELLQAQLRRRSPHLVAELHRRAGLWHEAHDMPAEAISHALAAGEYDRVVALLERHGWALLNSGYAHTLEGWLNALPPDRRGHSPRLSLDFGWMRLLRGALDQVGRLLAQAEAALDARDLAGKAALQAECLALQANLLQAQGRAAEALAAAERALALAPPEDVRLIGLVSLAMGGAYRQLPDFDRAAAALQAAIRASRASGDLVTEMLAVAHLTLMAVQFGRLRLAAGVATDALMRLEGSTAALPPIIGAMHGALGLIYCEWNQGDKARAHLQRGIRLSTLSGHTASAIYSHCNLARLLQAEGDLDGASQALAAAAALLVQGAPGWVGPELIGRQVSLALAQGDEAAAEAHLRTGGIAPDDPVTHHTDPLHLAWLRLLTARGDARAAELAQRLIASAEAGGRNGTLLQALILAARRLPNDPRSASTRLEQALALAEPEGALRVFLDEGEAMRLQLAECRSQMANRLRIAPGESAPRLITYTAQLLAAFDEPSAVSAPQSTVANRQAAVLIEPLSERELEVLRLLAAGLKYAEIAERLVISVNTVRFHVKEIYGKLGVNRQAQAVTRARELGLL
jgi:LuxR family maltose regulon positive regulatory protein